MKSTLVVLTIALVIVASLAIQARVTWDGSDTFNVAGGLIVLDAYSGLVTIPLLNVEYCPTLANCQFDK